MKNQVKAMKTTLRNLLAAMFIAASIQTHAQRLVYDQQTTNAPSVSGDYFNIQQDSPLLQSFVPGLSAIGFVQFQFWDIANNGTNGATVYVDLWTGSPDTSSATFLGSTTPVYMPNGFGASIAGVTNFYFSTPVALTAGQTYYLQPIVLSGDDPFDIKVLGNVAPFGDYYPNGTLYAQGTDVGIDLWFREGIVSAPEPSTLALIGLGSLLVLGFKRRFKLIIPLLFIASVLSVHASDSIVQATADEVGLTPALAKSVPENGTFWIITVSPDGSLMESPDPFLPSNLSALPIYLVFSNEFIVDDTGGLLSSSAKRMSSIQAASATQSQAASMASLINLIQTSPNGNQSFRPDFTLPAFGVNDIWLSITSATNGIAQIVIHPPLDNVSRSFNWHQAFPRTL